MTNLPFAEQIAVEKVTLRRAGNLVARRHRALGLPLVTGDEQRVVYLDSVTREEIPPNEVEKRSSLVPRRAGTKSNGAARHSGAVVAVLRTAFRH